MRSNPNPSVKPVLVGTAGVLSLAAGCAFLLMTFRGWFDRANADQYVTAEFEIVRYATETMRSSEDSCLIHGIIRPHNVEVAVSDLDVDLTRIGDSQGPVRMRPQREQVEGRTIPVRYFIGKPNQSAWLRRPVVTNSPVPALETIWLRGAISVGLLVGAYYCLRVLLRFERQVARQK